MFVSSVGSSSGVFLALLALSHVSRAQTLHSTRIASGFSSPTNICAPPGDAHRLFVTEQYGRVRVIRDAALLPNPFLDLGASSVGIGEGGLLSMAFHPHYLANGRFFLSFTAPDGASVLREYRVSADPDVADPASGVDVFAPIPHAYPHGHNGGQIQFGPDGMLYMSLGDAGVPDNGQSLATQLGKLLRIDIDVPAPHVPSDNPFGDPLDGIPDLIWALGFRQPWRFSFDRETGDLWLGDVGGIRREEIDFQPASSGVPGDATYFGGLNYGWKCREGTTCHALSGCTCGASPYVRPLHEYDHGPEACVIGGYVYRGANIPWLQGAYFFADFMQEKVWTLRRGPNGVTNIVDRTAELKPAGMWAGVSSVYTFGEDANGELYFTARATLPGTAIYRIDRGPEPCPDPVAECVAALNSTGYGAGMNVQGIACLSYDELRFVFSHLPSSATCVRIAGADPLQVPFGDGFLCIRSPILRLGAVQASSSGGLQWPVLPSISALHVTAGQTLRFQLVYRDAPAGPGHVNSSEAIAVTFGP